MGYGLIFKINDQVILAEYNEQGEVQDGFALEDGDNTYGGLNPFEIVLAEIQNDDEGIKIRDINLVTVANDMDEDGEVSELIEDGSFSIVARQLYQQIVVENSSDGKFTIE